MAVLARILTRALFPPKPGLYVALRPLRTVQVTEVGSAFLRFKLVVDPIVDPDCARMLSPREILGGFEELYGPLPAGEPPAPPKDDGHVFMALISCGGGYHDPRCSCFPRPWRPGSGLP